MDLNRGEGWWGGGGGNGTRWILNDEKNRTGREEKRGQDKTLLKWPIKARTWGALASAASLAHAWPMSS